MPSVDHLRSCLARAFEAREFDLALRTLMQLTKEEPREPKWPLQAARLFHSKRDAGNELGALRRALELQVDRGLVLEAIASCKAILELAPEDAQTLDTLELLYLEGPSSTPEDENRALSLEEMNTSSKQPERIPTLASEADAGLETLLLSDVVPGIRSIQIGDATAGGINEIPIDGTGFFDSESAIDLKLDRWSSATDPRDLAAAQAACMPVSVAVASKGSDEQRERGSSLRSELANVPLFGDLDPASLHTLIRKVRVVLLDAGQVLFRQGDPANTLYVVVEGAVVPIAEGLRRRKLAVLERGEFFGEIGLMAARPRNATIQAIVETKLLAIDRRVVWELIRKEPRVAKGILRFLRARLIDRQIRTNLFFGAFALAEREAVARQFRFLEVKKGATLIATGLPPEGLFVVLSGSLSVIERHPRGAKQIDTLELGDVFGGLTLLDGHLAKADVIASEKCWLVVLGEGRFRRILEANPRLERVLRRIALGKTKSSRRDLGA